MPPEKTCSNLTWELTMCCFSQPVEVVADTNIFARSANGRQFLVYSMAYAAATDLAMVLPLPVPPRPPEDAVRFISLERYPTFFHDMATGFPPKSGVFLPVGPPMAAAAGPTLQVHEVGSFEASFVPRLEDFDRLDERFRIPRETWDHLPAYRDFGFAVFKLRGSSSPSGGFLRGLFRGRRAPGRSEQRRVHPMAFEFPRRNPELLYFPTVHIHDRHVHPHASFDHMLYCQADAGMEAYLGGWDESSGPASTFMNTARTEGIVAPDGPCWRRPLKGRLKNRDTLVGKGGSVPVGG
jgi:hypothetical protein